MADITNLSSFLGDVADAIRSKKGSEESIPAKNFDAEILSIETGVDTSDADATEENIEKGKTAYVNGLKVTGTLANAGGSADIMVSADNISVGNQRGYDCVSTKYTNSGKKIHKDGWYVNQHIKFEDLAPALGVTPEKIAKGTTILGVEGTAEGSGAEINNQDKTVTKNGTYTADAGYTGLGNVTVNVQAEGIKQFPTVSDMNKDTTAKIGDRAIVYNTATKAIETNNYQVQNNEILYLKDTVVLPQAFGSSNRILQGINQSYSLSFTSTEFTISLGSTRLAEYTSTDGLTYRKTNGESYVRFLLKAPSSVMAPQLHFFETLVSEFNGLYEYTEQADTNVLTTYINPDYTNKKFSYTTKTTMNVKSLIDYIIGNIDISVAGNDFLVITEDENVFNMYYHTVNSNANKYACGIVSHDNIKYVTSSYAWGNACDKFYKIKINLNENTHEITSSDPIIDDYMKVFETFSATAKITVINLDTTNQGLQVFAANSGTTAQNSSFSTQPITSTILTKYYSAPNQFTLATANQIGENVIALGKDGVVKGNGSIVYTFDNHVYYDKIYGDKIVKQDASTHCTPTYKRNHIILNHGTNLQLDSVQYANLLPYTGEASTGALRCKYFTFGCVDVTGTYDVELTDDNELTVRLIPADEIIYRYTISERKTDGDRVAYMCIHNGIAYLFGKQDHVAYWYIVKLSDGTLTKIVKDYTGDNLLGFKTYTLALDGVNNRLYFGNYFTYSNTSSKIVVGYIDTNTYEYIELYTRDFTTTSVSLSSNSVKGNLTSNKQLLIQTQYIDSKTYYLFALLDTDGTVISENSITSYNGTLDSYPVTLCNNIAYDDGTYLYYGDYRYPKSTLVRESISEDITRYAKATFDFDIGVIVKDGIRYFYNLADMSVISSHTTLNSLYVYRSGWYGMSSPMLHKHNDKYILISSEIYRGSLYDCEYVTMDKKDNVLDAKYILDWCVIAKKTYSHQFNISLTPHAMEELENSSGGVMTKEEYDTCDNLATIALGETPILADPYIDVTLDVSNTDNITIEDTILVIGDDLDE